VVASAGSSGTATCRAVRAAAPLALLRLRGLATAVLAELAVEAAQPRGSPQPLALDLRAAGAVLVGRLEDGLRELARHDLHDRRDARAHELAAVAIDDVAARRLDAHLAHAVLARLADVVLARQHL
jgi:hypothetical protein